MPLAVAHFCASSAGTPLDCSRHVKAVMKPAHSRTQAKSPPHSNCLRYSRCRRTAQMPAQWEPRSQTAQPYPNPAHPTHAAASSKRPQRRRETGGAKKPDGARTGASRGDGVEALHARDDLVALALVVAVLRRRRNVVGPQPIGSSGAQEKRRAEERMGINLGEGGEEQAEEEGRASRKGQNARLPHSNHPPRLAWHWMVEPVSLPLP